jgi:hypothetical protein
MTEMCFMLAERPIELDALTESMHAECAHGANYDIRDFVRKPGSDS